MTTITETVRDARRTSVITLVSEKTGRTDKVRVCEPECRNETLLDLGVPHGRGGGWAYRGRGDAIVMVAWSGVRYHVTWKRCAPSAITCDHCGDAWTTRMPDLVASAAAPPPPPTEAQRRSREAFAVAYGRKPSDRAQEPAESPGVVQDTPQPDDASQGDDRDAGVGGEIPADPGSGGFWRRLRRG